MAEDRRGSKLRVDDDGVRIHARAGVRGGVWLVALAIALACVALLLVRRAPERDPMTPVARSAPAPAPAAANDPRAAARPLAPPVAPHRSLPVVPAAAPPPPAAPDAPAGAAAPPSREDPVFTQAKPGERTGIALFPPPGTKPIKRGLVVPDDFALPPGYVRHYQATDDGERVPAILMFHPDYHPVDADGAPIALPADRVVPPELAPPGMPIQMLELPENQGAQDAAP